MDPLGYGISINTYIYHNFESQVHDGMGNKITTRGLHSPEVEQGSLLPENLGWWTGWNITSWWVNQPTLKRYLPNWIISPNRDEHKNCLKPPEDFFCSTTLGPSFLRKLPQEPRIQKPKMSPTPLGNGKAWWWSSDRDPKKLHGFHLTCQPFPLTSNIPLYCAV